jgi:DNA-binding transcriptional ArsR family regulator
MNMSTSQSSKTQSLANLFQLIGQPTRIQILLAIGNSEACVCHLEAVTGLRQAVISQHLMLLRKAGLVTPNRAGRNIYYSLDNPGLLEVINQAALCLGIPITQLDRHMNEKVPGCPCPKCDSSGSCDMPGRMHHD